MKLTETMSAENVATLRALFARCDKDLNDMGMHERLYTPNGVYALNTYNELFWFMLNVRESINKSYVVRYVLDRLYHSWNQREEMSKRYIETGNENAFARYNAYTIKVITLQMLVSYVMG